jgi:hypothetical protein
VPLLVLGFGMAKSNFGVHDLTDGRISDQITDPAALRLSPNFL